MAEKLRKENDNLRTEIMSKEPGFGQKELLPSNQCNQHGHGHGHSSNLIKKSPNKGFAVRQTESMKHEHGHSSH